MNDICKDKIEILESLIEKASSAVITSHTRPDGDAVGSCAAMYHFLDRKGKKAVIVLPDESPAYLSFITAAIPHEDIMAFDKDKERADEAISGCDLIFSLDYNSFSRTGGMEDALSASPAKKVLIDHHLNPERSLFDISFSETEVSSTCEFLFHILMATDEHRGDAGRLPEHAACALLAGMTTDTNNFANSVFPSTFRMASALIEAGVDRDAILEHLYSEYREERLRLLGQILYQNMKITSDGVAYIVIDKETMQRYDLREGETEGFVNIPLSIGKVKMSCLFKEDPDRIRVSLRSKKGVSANRCAKMYFNGGGHEQASGGKLTIPDDVGSISEVARYVEKVMHEFMNTEN